MSPEVVEVCLTGLFLKDKFLNCKLIEFNIIGGRYTRHKMNNLDNFNDNLPLTINNIDTKGKFLWFELSNDNTDYYILNTFGLKGEWGLQLKPHTAIHIRLMDLHNDIHDLYFTDARNFGTIKLTTDIGELNNKLSSLGHDFLKQPFTEDEFYLRIKNYLISKNKRISKSRSNKEIVKVLMEQKSNTGIGSGLGNYLVVESLFIAKISPYKKMIDIYNNRQLSDNLSKAIKYIVKLSYMTADVGYMAHLDKDLSIWVKQLRSKIKRNTNHKLH
jgi:formamidopyrimidine-DNA glycosylase